MIKFPVKARPVAELKQASQPQSVRGGQSEANAWIFYDTATYTSATTTGMTFFTTTRANRQLSNLSPAGSLPDPQYFEVYEFGLNILRQPGNTDVLGDYFRLVKGTGTAGQGAPSWTFTLADKAYGPYPLASLHDMGGPTGFSTRTSQEFAQNSQPQGGGFFVDGAIIIPPQQAFNVQLTWPAAVTLSGNTDLVVWMSGVLHRRVL